MAYNGCFDGSRIVNSGLHNEWLIMLAGGLLNIFHTV